MILQKENNFFSKSYVIFLFSILLALISSSVSFSQHGEFGSVSGTILDNSSGKPLSNVNVYVAHSTIGTTTNAEGKFLIRQIPVGIVRIIVSSIGYQIQTEKVRIKANHKNELNFGLDKKIYQLPTVIVDSEDAARWQRNYEIFFAAFVGTSDNADECTIQDPYDLDFSRNDDGTLLATVTKPIEIINKALGYKITYFLESFRHFERSTKFNGSPVFEELKPADKTEEKKWERNRIKTYRGSLRHFLYAASRDYDNFLKTGKNQNGNDTSKTLLEREGFSVMSVRKVDVGFKKYEIYSKLSTPGFIYLSPEPNEKILSFPDRIQVTYLREKEDEKYLRFIGVFRDPVWQQSIIKLHSVAVKFNSRGYYF
ncbi:MAG: carboxypeptidase-like regulatory domain-containing protein, partial [Chlorobi bacterium]|nr:carboxypeptidase-like regulatory domain-containing protein [Chlorobiota bacterium]